MNLATLPDAALVNLLKVDDGTHHDALLREMGQRCAAQYNRETRRPKRRWGVVDTA